MSTRKRSIFLRFKFFAAFALLAVAMPGCLPSCLPFFLTLDDGPIAPGVTGKLGDPMPSLTPEQLATFERGKAVMVKRFGLSDGLGPAFNVTFCGACHEKPASGGSAALYRNFFIGAKIASNGAFVFTESQGIAGGVIRMFNHDPSLPARPPVPADTTIFAQRNAIPMFGVGLMAELTDEEILSRADPDDANGDGISGRPNFDRGFVGRFGLKCQTVSIEGFIRGPLFNHLGITTNPLTNEQRAQLPVNSAARQKLIDAHRSVTLSDPNFGPHDQAAAADGPNFDNDGVPDPEMSSQDLFDVVSFSMLLAAPAFDPPTFQTNHGRELFHSIRCSDCHIARLNGPRGPVPAYSDFLIHDMGPGLADGIVMKDASGSEFRTQPLWGISAEGPYLHDGRAATIQDAIVAHGGEAMAARDAFVALSEQDKTDIVEFLLSLGGRSQFSTGLVPPGDPIPAVGEFGGPFRALTPTEMEQFQRGREIFDRDFNFVDGAGGLAGPDGIGRFNGDSCRACHSDPVIGGAGPRGVNVMRHGINTGGAFSAPTTTPNTILHKEIRLGVPVVQPTPDINVFEMRQTPHVFGLGLIDAITEAAIRSNEDPADGNADGISGRANILPGDGRVGRFGWKADVPSVAEFVRDAMAAELGVTIAAQPNLTFGRTEDTDGIPDPELPLQAAEDLAFFMGTLAGPPRQTPGNAAQVTAGEGFFASVGCTKCHIPSLPSSLGDVPLFSDLLLHDILPGGTPGIESGAATQTEFRTAPLWGLRKTAPYFHDGSADSIDQAIRKHGGEATTARQAYEALSDPDRAALQAFLDTL